MRIVAGIATAGRPEVVRETLSRLERQERRPDRIIIAIPDDEELTIGSDCGIPVQLARSKRGSCAQRNAILAAAGEDGIISFIDDDFFPHRSYYRNLEALFSALGDVVGVNGKILRDGIHGAGLTIAEADEVLAQAEMPSLEACWMMDIAGAYGCNMAFRLAAARHQTFDESLPLYGWQEDIDFSNRLRRYGRLVRTDFVAGVHLGVKSGRSSGIRLGYSQIANPIYLYRKGTMELGFAANLMVRNLGANVLRVWNPEPHVDRVGRLRGNLIAIGDLLRGSLRPQRILEL